MLHQTWSFTNFIVLFPAESPDPHENFKLPRTSQHQGLFGSEIALGTSSVKGFLG